MSLQDYDADSCREPGGYPWPYDGPVPDDVCAFCSINHCHLCEDVQRCQCDHGYEWPSSGPWEALFRFSAYGRSAARRAYEDEEGW